MATVDGPAGDRLRQGAITAVGELGLDLGVGVHPGEVELVGERVEGIAVHIDARIAAEARPCEVLVSGIVKTSPPPPASTSRIAARECSRASPNGGTSTRLDSASLPE